MKEWKLHSHLDWKLQQVAVEIESQVRGWYNYYSKFGKTEFVKVMPPRTWCLSIGYAGNTSVSIVSP